MTLATELQMTRMLRKRKRRKLRKKPHIHLRV
jgi:hypothetical protein